MTNVLQNAIRLDQRMTIVLHVKKAFGYGLFFSSVFTFVIRQNIMYDKCITHPIGCIL